MTRRSAAALVMSLFLVLGCDITGGGVGPQTGEPAAEMPVTISAGFVELPGDALWTTTAAGATYVESPVGDDPATRRLLIHLADPSASDPAALEIYNEVGGVGIGPLGDRYLVREPLEAGERFVAVSQDGTREELATLSAEVRSVLSSLASGVLERAVSFDDGLAFIVAESQVDIPAGTYLLRPSFEIVRIEAAIDESKPFVYRSLFVEGGSLYVAGNGAPDPDAVLLDGLSTGAFVTRFRPGSTEAEWTTELAALSHGPLILGHTMSGGQLVLLYRGLSLPDEPACESESCATIALLDPETGEARAALLDRDGSRFPWGVSIDLPLVAPRDLALTAIDVEPAGGRIMILASQIEERTEPYLAELRPDGERLALRLFTPGEERVFARFPFQVGAMDRAIFFLGDLGDDGFVKQLSIDTAEGRSRHLLSTVAIERAVVEIHRVGDALWLGFAPDEPGSWPSFFRLSTVD